MEWLQSQEEDASTRCPHVDGEEGHKEPSGSRIAEMGCNLRSPSHLPIPYRTIISIPNNLASRVVTPLRLPYSQPLRHLTLLEPNPSPYLLQPDGGFRYCQPWDSALIADWYGCQHLHSCSWLSTTPIIPTRWLGAAQCLIHTPCGLVSCRTHFWCPPLLSEHHDSWFCYLFPWPC